MSRRPTSRMSENGTGCKVGRPNMSQEVIMYNTEPAIQRCS